MDPKPGSSQESMSLSNMVGGVPSLPDIRQLFLLAVDRRASDLHLITGLPPMLRIDGQLTMAAEVPPLTRDETKRMIYSMLTDRQKAQFER